MNTNPKREKNKAVKVFNLKSEEPHRNIQIMKNSLIMIFTLTIFRTDRRIQNNGLIVIFTLTILETVGDDYKEIGRKSHFHRNI